MLAPPSQDFLEIPIFVQTVKSRSEQMTLETTSVEVKNVLLACKASVQPTNKVLKPTFIVQVVADIFFQQAVFPITFDTLPWVLKIQQV